MRRKSISSAPTDRYVAVADGLRVFFIFVVGWYHIWQQSWLMPYFYVGPHRIDLFAFVRTGYMWVDGMLLLSGMLTFLPYARAMADKKPLPGAKDFYRKRVARILPAYLLCIFVVLFADSLPNGLYSSPKYLWLDLLSHLTFTHTFFPYSYFNTHLNVVLWTLAVEVQFYLIFPLLAKAFTRRPGITFAGMVAAAWLYRGYVAMFVADNNIWINQLIAFMDIYALGFLAAWIYVQLTRSVRPTAALQILMSAVCVILVWLLYLLVMRQHSASGYEEIRDMQMRNRFALGAVLSMLILCASYSLPAIYKLLSNKLMIFLSGISFQFYIWHQYLAVALRRLNIPYSASAVPNQDGEILWQWKYTLLAFGVALIASIAVTYLFEKPMQKRLRPKPRRKKATQS